jgi:stress response protein YsnF
MPEVRTEGDVTIVPVVEEEPVVTTRQVLREEIRITRRRGQRSVDVPLQLLRQRAVVTRARPAETQQHQQRNARMADSSYGSRTLTAFFDNRADADTAMQRLRDIGFAESDIRLTGGESYAGADSDRGFWESLSDFFFPSEDRAAYAEGLRRGGYLVTVPNVSDSQHDTVLDILDDEGSIDMDERAEAWRTEGWTGAIAGSGLGVAGATAGAGTAAATDLPTDDYTGERMASDRLATDRLATDRPAEIRDDEVIPVVREDFRVGKRDVDRGRVRVRAYMVEEPVSEEVTLRDERVEIERRPVDRAVKPGEQAFTDRTIEAEERSEEAVISKEARVVEEIGLRRRDESRTETVSDTVRHTEVEVEDERPAPVGSGGATRR